MRGDANAPHSLFKTEPIEVDGEVGILAWDQPRGHAASPMDITVKVVCKGCNNGWMAQLEADTQPTLRALMDADGSPLQLNPDQVRLLRRWAIKTTAMFEFNDPSGRTFSKAVLEGLRRDSDSLPGVWSVGLLRTTDFDNYFRISHTGGPYAGSWADGRRAPAPHGHIGLTIFSAHTVVFVVRHCNGRWAEKMIRELVFTPEPHELDPDQVPAWPAPVITSEQWKAALTFGPIVPFRP